MIHESYKSIMKGITGGIILGVPINENGDIETLVVAAYYYGYEKGRKAEQKSTEGHEELLLDLLGAKR